MYTFYIMLWEYKLKYMGRILDRVPTKNDWNSKNFDIKFINNKNYASINNFYLSEDWIWSATLNYRNNEDYIKQKVTLLELEKKTICNKMFPNISKTYLKCLITNPYLNNKTFVHWIDNDWVMPLVTETIEELKLRLVKDFKK